MSEHREGPQWTWQFWTAIGIVMVFVVLVVVMFLTAGDDEMTWQRRIYLFGAVEALVFTAVGWIFGREVHRSAAANAERDAAAAKEDAAVARETAAEHAAQAEAATRHAAKEDVRGQAVLAAVHSMADTVPETISPRDVAIRDESASDARSALRALRAFVDELYR